MLQMNESTILLVEDEDQQREVLSLLLENEGYRTLCFRSAEEALLELEHIRPDLIITDVKLIGLDGFSLYEKILTMPEFQKTPFIFITGYNDPKAIEAVKVLGAVGYITKPYEVEELLTVVKKTIPSTKHVSS